MEYEDEFIVPSPPVFPLRVARILDLGRFLSALEIAPEYYSNSCLWCFTKEGCTVKILDRRNTVYLEFKIELKRFEIYQLADKGENTETQPCIYQMDNMSIFFNQYRQYLKKYRSVGLEWRWDSHKQAYLNIMKLAHTPPTRRRKRSAAAVIAMESNDEDDDDMEEAITDSELVLAGFCLQARFCGDGKMPPHININRPKTVDERDEGVAFSMDANELNCMFRELSIVGIRVELQMDRILQLGGGGGTPLFKMLWCSNGELGQVRFSSWCRDSSSSSSNPQQRIASRVLVHTNSSSCNHKNAEEPEEPAAKRLKWVAADDHLIADDLHADDLDADDLDADDLIADDLISDTPSKPLLPEVHWQHSLTLPPQYQVDKTWVGRYSARYLKFFTKLLQGATTVHVVFGKDQPLILSVQLEEDIQATTVICPIMGADTSNHQYKTLSVPAYSEYTQQRA